MPPIFNKKQVMRYSRYLVVTLSLATLLRPGLTLAAQRDEADGQSRHGLSMIWNDSYQLLQTGLPNVISRQSIYLRRAFRAGSRHLAAHAR